MEQNKITFTLADLVDVSLEDGEKAGNSIIESHVQNELENFDDLITKFVRF